MFLDALLVVSDAQAFTASAVSTNSIDTGNVTPRRHVADGEAMGFGVAIDVAADFTTGDETYAFNVISDEDPALGSPTVHATYAILAAQLTIGSLHFLPFPRGGKPQERYIGVSTTLAGTTPTVTATIWFTSHDLFSIAAKNYAKGFTV